MTGIPFSFKMHLFQYPEHIKQEIPFLITLLRLGNLMKKDVIWRIFLLCAGFDLLEAKGMVA